MGVFATAIFDVRNIGKVGHGDTGRAPVSIAQTTNLVNAASHSTYAPLKNSANVLLNGVDDAGRLIGVANAASKVTGIASKAVNPLLCVASGMRVMKDDDPYAALIEEGCAMSAMFAGEKLFKHLVANPLAQKEVKTSTELAAKIVSKVDDFSKGLTGKKKIAANILADIALVGVSIFSFDMGKKLGKTLSHRNNGEKATQVQTQGLDYKS